MGGTEEEDPVPGDDQGGEGIQERPDQRPVIVRPRVGGITGGTAWTGGSVLVRQSRPKTVFACRPETFSESFKVERACT